MDFTRILNFLKELTNNNNRDWFNDNKPKFIEIKSEFEQFIAQLIPKIREIDPLVGPIEAKDCIFRIYRDVRFSKNKNPYKNHLGAYISNGGRKGKFAGYYLHIQPSQSFFAAGVFRPEPPILKEIRYEILDNTKEFKQIIESNQFKKQYSNLKGEKLKTVPKGFSKDFEDIDLLRFKSYEIFHEIPENQMYNSNLENYLLNLAKVAHPFNSFMNKVIEHTLAHD